VSWDTHDGDKWRSAFDPPREPSTAPAPERPAAAPHTVTRRSPLLRTVEVGAVLLSILSVVGLGMAWARIAEHFSLYHRATGDVPTQLWVYYGEPTPLAQAVGGTSPQRRVCDDRVRPKAAGGTWNCELWFSLDRHSIGEVAVALPPGPCSHERVNQQTHAWECWTNVDIPPIIRDAPPGAKIIVGDLRGTGFCLRELLLQGRWRCIWWGARKHGYRVVQVFDSGQPCDFRVVDQVTGVWSCRRSYMNLYIIGR